MSLHLTALESRGMAGTIQSREKDSLTEDNDSSNSRVELLSGGGAGKTEQRRQAMGCKEAINRALTAGFWGQCVTKKAGDAYIGDDSSSE